MNRKIHTIYAITLNYKTYDCLKRCLSALESSELPEGWILRIIVIDSEFDEEVLTSIIKQFPKVTFIPEKKNLGVGGGFNKGFKLALEYPCDYLFMVTPDITVGETVLQKLLKKALSDPHIGMVAPKMLLNTKPPKIYFVAGKLDPKVKSSIHIGYEEVDKNQFDTIEETDFLNCASVLIKRDIFYKVGYMDPQYFLYYEDTDWTLRVKRAGYSLLVVKDAVVFHDESSSVGKHSPRQDYYTSRNLLYFIHKNFNPTERFIAYVYTMREAVLLIMNLLNKNKQKHAFFKLLGMRDFVLGKTGYKQF